MGLYQHVLSKEPSLASDNAREPGANAIWNKLKQQHPKKITHDKKSDRFIWNKKIVLFFYANKHNLDIAVMEK